MRSAFIGLALLCTVAAAPAYALQDSDVITSISLGDLSDLLNSRGLSAEVVDLQGSPAVRANLGSAANGAYIHIGGLGCGNDTNATNATTPCQVLEFAAVIGIPAGVTESQIAQIDRKFELSSIERIDATHALITDGMVLIAGVTVGNIGANIGFFAGQATAVLEELNNGAGKSV
jgi:hypothetical protein